MKKILTENELTRIADQFRLRLIVQFGSSLDPEALAHPESDIDLAVLADHRLSLDELVALQGALATVFGVFEDRIDLVDLRDANSLLAHQIATKGRPLFDRDGHQFNQFYVTAVRRKIDEAGLFDLGRQLLAQRVAKIDARRA